MVRSILIQILKKELQDSKYRLVLDIDLELSRGVI